MANLIRLKQIESGSSLQTSAQIGTDFSASVNNIVSQSIETTFSASIVQIITNNVGAVLPDGVISSSAQVLLISASGYNQLATDLEVSVISGSIASTINFIASGSWFVTTASFHSYTASLGDTFATDVEVYQTASAIIDQGEF